ncbi:hypothetical protein B566_EDAN011284 [Ephemera danica]|nr:hypothetical protein B566_EDAN011284 [Ephemera danica]
MSVFGDFRKVWVQRFPGSELPAAWEEDVRANLSKHKQKVAVLKEELEKEEFYVEYLERLLSDVEHHKEENELSGVHKPCKQDNALVNTTSPDPQHGEEKEQRGTTDKLVKTKEKDRLSLCEDSANKCISELSVSMNEALLSPEEEEEETELVQLRKTDGNSAARQRSNTFSDASNYVTVIEVNGMNLRAAKALSSIETSRSNNANNNQKMPLKKVPPKPPPKTFQNKTKEDSSSSESTGKKSNDSSLDRKLTDAVEEEKMDTKPEKTASNSSTLARGEAEDTRQLVEAADMIVAAVQGEEDGDTGEAVSSLQEEEPLYDKVPLDAEGDYVYLATSSVGNGTSQEKASNESGGSMSDLDGETTMKSQASGYSACSSETGTTDTEPGPTAATPPPESPKRSNYVNIDYFIKNRGTSGASRGHRTDSLESDDDVPPLLRSISSEPEDEEDGFFVTGRHSVCHVQSLALATPSPTGQGQGTVNSEQSEDAAAVIKDSAGTKAEAERIAMWRCIVSSILESETIFLEGLGVLLQYMKAIRATLSSSQPVISQDDFNTIFYKVPELHAMHQTFLTGLKKAHESNGSVPSVGEHFRVMASQINEYGAFLHNYGRATDTVRKCKQSSTQFAQIMHSIPLRSKGSEQRLSLEDLLHKPVARVQKNALVLHDLLRYTPESYPDHKALTEALKMNQNFLDEFNMIQTKSMFPSHDRAQRRLVKNSFIVELADGHRKLRHLFLFNDVIACAKYKASGRDKFTFELKWYIALSDIVVYEEFAAEPREASPANIVALKSAACTVRDQILWQERQIDDKRSRQGGRAEKQRKKLADLEAQLVLASPNLVFRVGQRNQRPYTFFLSSEFERTQWIDAIHALQVFPDKYASSSSLDATPSVTSRVWHWPPPPPPAKAKQSEDAAAVIKDSAGTKAEAERIAMWRCIVSSILESETIFLEGLGVLLQYMKAIRATLSSSQPVISQDDFNTIFYKVPELHAMHQTFLTGLKKAHESNGSVPSVGEHFRVMASQINEYGAFLHNYGRATDTVRKCKQSSTQFAQIMHSIPLRSKGSEQRLSLEDLLHKPVARVQKNALVLHDLLRYTPESYPDHKALTEALKMNQNFLDEFNMIQTKSMFPSHDRAQRRLVKNSFIVELADGHRKLRHLFLFNDVIACAKYKASGRDKFTFELKWYIALSDIVVYEEFAAEPREASPANIVALKSAACTVRDQILWQERQIDDKRSRQGGRAEKQRKKLADLEAQLVLASPNLVFRVGQRNQRPYTFFLSSEFERTQWIDAIHALQASQLPGPNVTVGMDELQAWITACRTFLKTDMGSYLLRSGRDESLLLGDLHVRVCRLKGLETPADLAVCLEVDSYGHYFRKARTKLVCGTATPVWDEEFIIELEGSQNLRVLLYEETGPRALSRSWLGDQRVSRTLTLQGCELELSLRFVPSEVTLRRVPTAKSAGLFGAKIQHVCKRQKRPVPFIITSCVREVERRGMNEIGIYRVSGSASDLTRLKKSFETNSYEAEQLLKEVDVHSVTGVLKLYLRELPEALFTDELYPRLFDIFNNPTMDGNTKRRNLLILFQHLPGQNQHIITNKMSLHNLATVFGPTLLRPGSSPSGNTRHRDALAAGTVDVMAQAGILYHFLQSFVTGEIRTPAPSSPAPGANHASSALSSLSSSSSMAS